MSLIYSVKIIELCSNNCKHHIPILLVSCECVCVFFLSYHLHILMPLKYVFILKCYNFKNFFMLLKSAARGDSVCIYFFNTLAFFLFKKNIHAIERVRQKKILYSKRVKVRIKKSFFFEKYCIDFGFSCTKMDLG